MNNKVGVGIIAVVVLGWSGMVLAGTTSSMLQSRTGSMVIEGSLEKDGYLRATISSAPDFRPVNQVYIRINLNPVNLTYVPGNVTVCMVPLTVSVNKILDNFNDTSKYSPMFFAMVLLNQTQDEFTFSYDQVLNASVSVYIFGGNASTGAGWWNNALINVATVISYQWQYVGQEYANLYGPSLFGAGIGILLAIGTLALLRKKGG